MKHRLSAALAIGVGLAVSMAPVAVADDDDGISTEGLRKAVTTVGINEHLRAFQSHSALGGNRVASSPGFEASADYVESKLERAGYDVTRDPFVFTYNADIETPVFSVTGGKSYVDGTEFSSMTFSPNGDDTAPLWAVDVVQPDNGAGNLSTSGCEAADFAGFPQGAIALVQRGTCSFEVKTQNAAAAGAVATIVFNEGQPGRTAPVAGTLTNPQTHSAQTIGTSFEIGSELSNGVKNGDTGKTVRVKVERLNEQRTTENVIAELPKGGLDDDDDDDRRSDSPDTSNVLVVGAHLDSVPRGPGINDNGSGSGGILEIAEQMAKRDIEPKNTVRFMWYSAEEFGLLGSRAYVAEQLPAERARIKAMLNFDMIASPNYVRFVYDGDNSAFPPVTGSVEQGPPGSGEIEAIFANYFSSQGLASAPTPFNGRSDYGPFIAQGIPAGGLFTGAEGVKTAEQAAIYGGEANVAYDKCYHLACDTFDNVNQKGLDEMSDAAAHTSLTLAKRNFVKKPLVNPAPQPAGPGDGGGGGLHADHDHDTVSE